MSLCYPVFILATDDLSMDLIDSETKLKGWFEEPDVEEGLYVGWDSLGVPFKLEWQKGIGAIPKTSSSIAEPEKLKTAVLTYAERYTADTDSVFVPPQTGNMVELFNAIEEHIRKYKVSFWKKLRRKFSRHST